jgi:hypothetical protein
MRAVLTLVVVLFSVAATGCDLDSDRITKLEKQTQDLKAQVDRDSTARDYDLQAKCSTETKAWFQSNWQRDKDTILLDYTNHYSKSQNSCFIEVELHLRGSQPFEWTNNISLWNVLENSKLGEIYDRHYRDGQDFKEDVYVCSVWGTSCKSLEEFNKLAQPYLSN